MIAQLVEEGGSLLGGGIPAEVAARPGDLVAPDVDALAAQLTPQLPRPAHVAVMIAEPVRDGVLPAELYEHGSAALAGDGLAAVSGEGHHPAAKVEDEESAVVMEMRGPHPVVKNGADDDEVGMEMSEAVSGG